MPVVDQEIVIASRFCGPPDSGNGGYACGLTAQGIRGPAEVRLLRPPPLNVPLRLSPLSENKIQLLWGEEPIAEARPVSFDLQVPPPISFQEAQEFSKNYLGFKDHQYPTCFVCGPNRKEKDGLRIFPGRASGKNLLAAPWIPDATLGDAEGWVRPEFLWAALDCPGGFAAMTDHFPTVLLGTLSADIEAKLHTGDRTVAMAWSMGSEGRKLFVGSALYSEKGKLLAKAKGVWILLKS
jgi:hypothetical protein